MVGRIIKGNSNQDTTNTAESIQRLISNALDPKHSPLRTINIVSPLSTLRIALFPMNIPLDKFDQLEDNQHKLLIQKAKYSEKISKQYIRCTKEACEEGAKVICFSELSFPFKAKNIIKKLAKLSARHGAYIIAGTYHDPETCYNTSLIFTPYREEPFKQYKINIAGRVGEIVDVPHGPQKINAWFTEFGIMTILICLDVYDAENKKKILYFNKRCHHGGIDLIVVPSYNSDAMERVKSAIYDLSLQSCIVYVNDTSQGGGSGVFHPGGEEELLEISCFEDTTFYLCDINIEKVRNKRITLNTGISDYLKQNTS